MNRKRAWKKSRKLPNIKCAVIKENWEDSRGIHANMASMGLSSDPNLTMKIPSTLENLKASLARDESVESIIEQESKNVKATKEFVVEALEKEAAKPMNSSFHVSNDVALFAKHMIDKYGSDYKAMARDPRNYYQLTPKQIKRRIEEHTTSRFIAANKLANKEMDED